MFAFFVWSSKTGKASFLWCCSSKNNNIHLFGISAVL